MSTHQLTIIPKGNPLAVAGTWDAARQWLDAAHRFEQCKLFAQVMLGFHLLDLKKQHGVENGNNQHQGRVSHNDKPSEDWETILEKETSLSAPHAYRIMAMAKAAVPRLKKVPALKNFDPLANPLSQITDGQKDALDKSLHKLTDGLTQKEFGESLGLWKKSGGNVGRKPGEGGRKKLSTAEQAAALRAMALEDSGRLGHAIEASNKNFFLLTDVNDLEVDAQIAALEHAAKIRRQWIATPRTKRNPDHILKSVAAGRQTAANHVPTRSLPIIGLTHSLTH